MGFQVSAQWGTCSEVKAGGWIVTLSRPLDSLLLPSTGTLESILH